LAQSQTAEIYFIGPSAAAFKTWRTKLPAIKKRLGELKLKEIKRDIKGAGALIIYDKLIYLPSPNQALLIENQLIAELIKSLLEPTF